MIFFPLQQLKYALDKVRTDPALAPSADGSVTHCDSNAFLTAAALGLPNLWAPLQDATAMANNMVDFMEAHPERFSKFTDHLLAWNLVNKGCLIYAALKEAQHGHIALLIPSIGMETSGRWGIQIPYVSNVGKVNDVMGLNYAFSTLVPPPAYFLVVDKNDKITEVT